MAEDFFEHDAERFEAAAVPGGVDLADAEARYADLFAEAIWDGTITAEKRQQLNNAGQTFRLSSPRIEQIERSLIAAHEARYQFAVVEEETNDLLGGEHTTERHSVSPLAIAQDPGQLALQKRIGALEEQLYKGEEEKHELRTHVQSLQKLVEQLQFALESTLEELDDTHQRLDESRSHPPQASQIPPPPPPPPVPQISAVPEADHSVAQARSGQYEETCWDTDTFEMSPPVPLKRHNPDEIFRRLTLEPRDPGLLHALYHALGRGEDLDRRWCIAHVLTFLGHADGAEKELAARHEVSGLVRPHRAVNDDEWRELLFHPEEDQLIGEILSHIAPAVLLGHLTAMRASIAPAVLDPATHVDPKTSTLQAVRCLAWAAAFLGLNAPPIYVVPEHKSTAEIVLNPTPSTRVGTFALSGRDTRELAFIAGRHMTWYRREHLLGKPQRSTRRLEDMFLAALMIGNPGLPMTPEVKERVEPIARTIRPLLADPTVERLREGFTRFVELGGRTNLSRWFRAVERTAARAGLLLCNDLGAAYRMLKLEDEARAPEALDELILFFIGSRSTRLRKRIGIAVT
jgi:uncharacterized coiled-coil protein SlyX